MRSWLGLEPEPVENVRAVQMPPLVASAQRMDIDSERDRKRLKADPSKWQQRAWSYVRVVPEVQYGINKLADALSKLRMVPAVQIEPDEDPVPIPDAIESGLITEAEGAVVLDTVRRLNLGIGHAEIFRRLGIHLSVPGECYLVGIAASGTDEERWEIRSTREVTVDGSGNAYLLEGDEDRAKRLLTSNDLVGRLWVPDPEMSAKAWSPLHSILDTCEELLILDRAARSTERSRNNAGLLLLPEELDDGAPGDPTSEDDETAGDDLTLEMKILKSMTTPIRDEGSAAAVVPHIIYGKADLLEKVRHIDLGRSLDDWAIQRQAVLRERLASGMNWPQELILGLGDTNHWSAWAITDDGFKSHVEPLALQAVAALTRVYLHPMLRAAMIDNPRRFVVWYDAGNLIAQPDRGKDATELYDRLEISGRALRDAKNFADEDMPDEEELERRIELERIKNPAPQQQGGERRPEPAPEDRGAPEADEPTEDEAPGQAQARRLELRADPAGIRALAAARLAIVAAATPVETNHGARLRAIDATARDRMLGAFDASMRRALERAGNRLVSRVKASKNAAWLELIRNRSALEVALALGPDLVQRLGESEDTLLDGAFTDLRERFDGWVAGAQRQALRVVPNLTDTDRAQAETLQRADREEAWAWTLAELQRSASTRLFAPEPKAPPRGEFDQMTLVPAGVARGAMARAGGADREQGVGVALGIASGLLVGRLLDEHGIQTNAWVWRYGEFPRTNPFEPHEALDGAVFERWDDPMLANADGWPPGGYYAPGDHDGCVCDWERVTVERRSA